MSNANLSFLPWVRQGIAAAITTPDPLGPGLPAMASLSTELSLNDAPVPGVRVKLRGPADVLGIDPAQVIRCDPPPGSSDVQPNAFASIEFDRADFPWLFTPARADAQSRLRPWLSLIVIRPREGVQITSSPLQPLPVLQIDDPRVAAQELPDLREAWAWAHAQVAAADASAAGLAAALDGSPVLSLSRLICPRQLAPGTDYVACVVPTFEPGRRAGLGMSVSPAELEAAGGLATAWPWPPAGPGPLRLPVYHQWAFRTGESGDFEALVRRLKPATPEGLGQRLIDISQAGFPAGALGTLPMQGALVPLAAAPAAPVDAAIARAYQDQLAALVNAPALRNAQSPGADPLVAPPLYGSVPAARTTVAPGTAHWLDELNLDPRARAVAALGTRVVQAHQEALMTAAWEQAGDLMPAVQRLRHLQLGMSVAESLERRHLARMGEEDMLRFAAPAFGRLQAQPGVSLLAEQAGSRLPLGATGWAMRRIGRPRGPLRRRVRGQSATAARAGTLSWIARLNGSIGVAAVPAPARPQRFCTVPPLPIETLETGSYYGAFFVAAEGAPTPDAGSADVPCFVAGRTELPGHFRAAAKALLARSGPFVAPPPSPALPSFEAVAPRVKAQMTPALAYAALARATVSTRAAPGLSAAAAEPAAGLAPPMFAPRFVQPAARALQSLAPDLLLPGLHTVPADSVVGLRTNPRFVAAFMAGLNHEMARELLWRGFPTDSRGTCFAHFWRDGAQGAAPDVQDLDRWGERRLDDSAGLPQDAAFVLLLRSALLQRYPDAVITLVPALPGSGSEPRRPDLDAAHEHLPAFSGALPPDLAFFGFDVTADMATGADGGPGFYVVIQEHPTAPRFGLDAGVNLGGASHLVLGTTPPAGVPLNGRRWAANAAEMAAITRRLPARIAIHASRLLGRPPVQR